MARIVNGSLHSHGCWTNHKSPSEIRKFPFNLENFVEFCVSCGRDFQAITDFMANPPGESELIENRYQDLLDTASLKVSYELEAGGKESIIYFSTGKKFTLIRTQEVLTNKNFKHILAIGAEESIRGGRSVEDTLNEIKDKGGYAIIDHPFIRNAWGEEEIGELYSEKKIIAIEWNGVLTFPSFIFPSKLPSKKSNIRALKLAEEIGIPCIANDDSHYPSDIQRGAYTSYCIEDLHPNLTEKIVEAIKDRSFRRKEQYSGFFSPVIHVTHAIRGKKLHGEL